MSEQASRKHPAVIHNQNVARMKMSRKAPKFVIGECAGTSIQDQHARSRAVVERLLGDQLFWQMEIKIRKEHGAGLYVEREGVTRPRPGVEDFVIV
jgi:hypothetical protein